MERAKQNIKKGRSSYKIPYTSYPHDCTKPQKEEKPVVSAITNELVEQLGNKVTKVPQPFHILTTISADGTMIEMEQYQNGPFKSREGIGRLFRNAKNDWM